MGVSYVDRIANDATAQPKVIIMLLIQNSDGDVLLQRRTNQPYINTWTLPHGKLHMMDESVEAAAQRVASETLGRDNQTVVHAGDCYIRVTSARHLLSSTFVHVCTFNADDIEVSADVTWARPHKLAMYRLAPAVEAIVARGFFRDLFFFEEFESDWYN